MHYGNDCVCAWWAPQTVNEAVLAWYKSEGGKPLKITTLVGTLKIVEITEVRSKHKESWTKFRQAKAANKSGEAADQSCRVSGDDRWRGQLPVTRRKRRDAHDASRLCAVQHSTDLPHLRA